MKQKLLLVADTYYPKVDGTLIFMEEFLKRAQDSFEVSLLVPKLGKKKHRADTIFIKPSPFFSLSGYPNMALLPGNFRKIKKAIKQSDLVFIQGPAGISYLSMYYGKKYKKKTVFYLHVLTWDLFAKFMPPFINRLFFNLIKRISIFLYNHCNEILVPYKGLEEQLRKAGITTKITVARLGVDINAFTPTTDKKLSKKKLGISPAVKVIGYVGRISREKNIDILVEAFKKLPDQKHLLLLMVGDGPQDQVKACKELKNCKVTGFVKNVDEHLKATDIFVMPSLTETTSLATLEAMSSGLPVVVTKIGFIKNYVVRDHNGLFFPKNNASMLAMKLEKLLKDKELGEKLGRNARKTIAYSFSWERSINKIKRVLLQYGLRE